MSETPPSLPSPSSRPAPPLGVLDAVGMGWRLMMSDFWALWLAAFVMLLILMAAGMFGVPAQVLVAPPLAAGLFYVLAKRIDGGRAEVGDLFAGFKERFGPSVVGMLPVTAAGFVLGILIGAALGVLFALGGGIIAAAEGEEEVVAVVVIGGLVLFILIELLLILAFSIFAVFFYFVPAAVWDHPESGWAAAKASMRLVRGHFLSMIGFVLVFWAIGTAANLIGMLACCIGVFFTTPLLIVWQYATLVYLYRSWTGRPLVQARASDADAAAGGN